MNAPVYTTENACQDCYKCVRHCPVKAIRVVDGKASVIPEACLACGLCVKICPQHAKKVRIDMPRLKALLASGEKVYASVAPSFAAYFKGVSIGRLATALKRVGFAGVSETAHGAEAVSAHVSKLFEAAPRTSVMISSACPACVDYVRKYLPDWAKFISPLPSPVRAHVRLLREKLGPDAKVVFFGPCAAKKNEADRHPDELAFAIVFPALVQLFEEQGIDPASVEEESDLVLGPAAEGRFYSVEGGMNDTIRDAAGRVRFVSVSGLDNLGRLLSSPPPPPEGDARPIFVEARACPGGCVNGPAMDAGDIGTLDALRATDAAAPIRTSVGRTFAHCGAAAYPAETVASAEPSEEDIARRVKEMGAELTEQFQGKKPLFLGVLKGCFVFMSDLIRACPVKSDLEFIAVSSYGNATSSSGRVQITHDVQQDITGRDLIIVEDILDSGNTLAFLKDYLRTKGAASITIVTLLDKPSRRVKAVKPDLAGFVVPDEFVVGYGLDYAQEYRNLPYIGVLKPEVYTK